MKCPVCHGRDVRDWKTIPGDGGYVEFDNIYYGPYKLCREGYTLYAHGEPL